MSDRHTIQLSSDGDLTPTEQVIQRICSEFREMPGMRITSRQAQRLWGLDEETCTRLLGALVEVRFLSRVGSDGYRRTSDGPPSFPSLKMAKGALARSMRVKEAV